MTPEEALERARAARFDDDLSGFVIEPTDRISTEQLMEWAVIEPDPDLVYSTRRWGAPITWVKRLLLRALRQYHGQIVAEQTRFNLHVMVYVAELEDRIAALEAERDGRVR